MERKGQDREKSNEIDEKVRVAFGTDEGQLAEEYDRLAARMEASKEPSVPEGEFEKILARFEKSYEKNINQMDDKSHLSYYNVR